MTRIISGVAGGRRLRVPPAGTRPTSDRVREAVFNILESRIDFDGLRALDLYAGSGALGLEALSRGAVHVLLVEQNAKAAAVIDRNIVDLGLRGATVSRGSVANVIAAQPDRPYGLVLSDPPYDVPATVVEKDLADLVARGWLDDDAIVLVERSARTPRLSWPAGLELLRTKDYGETRIEVGRHQGGEHEQGA